MFVVVVLFVLLCQVKGDFKHECRESGNGMVNMKPAASGILGRYTVELCTSRIPNAAEWEVDLWYYNVTDCNLVKRRLLNIHSVNKEDITKENITCNNITCFTTDFDLIFASCYSINSVFKNGSKTLQRINKRKTITNNLTLNHFAKDDPQIVYIPNKEFILLRWIVGIPVSKPFILDLWRNDTKEDNMLRPLKSNITDNCTLSESAYEVVCKLVVPQGCYSAELRHNPLWSSVLYAKTEIVYNFCLENPSEVVVCNDDASAWGWGRGMAASCGAALLVAAALLAAALARKGVIARNFHKRVLEGWRKGRESESSRTAIVSSPSGAGSRRVLLLYAREGECGARAVRALADLLQRATCGEVLDLYSPEVMALASPAPGAWLRAALCHPDTRVLLLQTPALAALYTTHVDHTNLNLLEPLLGRRAMYRAPAFGDQLLQLALRLMAETLTAHHDYHKYYFATYGSLETDVLPAVVPFRRYVLPAATHALLRDLSPSHESHESHNAQESHDTEVDMTLINHLESAVDDFVLHVKENQNYLMEDLMII